VFIRPQVLNVMQESTVDEQVFLPPKLSVLWPRGVQSHRMFRTDLRRGSSRAEDQDSTGADLALFSSDRAPVGHFLGKSNLVKSC
jgi:hypothetical protein